MEKDFVAMPKEVSLDDKIRSVLSELDFSSSSTSDSISCSIEACKDIMPVIDEGVSNDSSSEDETCPDAMGYVLLRQDADTSDGACKNIDDPLYRHQGSGSDTRPTSEASIGVVSPDLNKGI